MLCVAYIDKRHLVYMEPGMEMLFSLAISVNEEIAIVLKIDFELKNCTHIIFLFSAVVIKKRCPIFLIIGT